MNKSPFRVLWLNNRLTFHETLSGFTIPTNPSPKALRCDKSGVGALLLSAASRVSAGCVFMDKLPLWLTDEKRNLERITKRDVSSHISTATPAGTLMSIS